MNIRRDTILPEGINREALCNVSGLAMIRTIFKYHNMQWKDIAVRCRKRELVDVRHIVNYFLTVKKEFSLQYIASIFETDHCVVINSRKQVESWITTDKSFKEKIIDIATLIINSTK